MGLKLLPAEYTDMRELVEVIYTANSDPRDPFVDLCLPGLGAWSKATREEGVEKITKMYLEEWKESTTQTWLKIIDEDSGKVVSASKWEIFDQNPYAEGIPHIGTEWLPASTRLREYAEWLINTRMGQAAARCQCPHVWLDICVTIPAYRHRGAASLSLQWGIDKADEMNAEAFIEATIEGAHLYEKFGFVTKQIVDLKEERLIGDEEWERLAEEYPLRYRWMEREKKSKWSGSS